MFLLVSLEATTVPGLWCWLSGPHLLRTVLTHSGLSLLPVVVLGPLCFLFSSLWTPRSSSRSLGGPLLPVEKAFDLLIDPRFIVGEKETLSMGSE